MNKPLRPCAHPGCNVLTKNGYCEKHKPKRNDNRKSASKRGYNSKWSKASKTFLKRNPFCAECLKNNIYTPATETDHIVPHKGNMELFWDTNNWQGLCHKCHSRKTAREDGGFGRPPHI